MSSASRSPTRSRQRDRGTEDSGQGRQRKTSLSLKPSSLSANIGGTSTTSTRYQSTNPPISSSASSSLRRQSLFGTDDRVVMDIGARVTKIGFSGESRPRDMFWSLEGNEASSSHDNALWTTDMCRCKSEQERRLIEVRLKARLTSLFRRIFYQRLMIDPKQRKVIISENALLPDIVKITICEVLFGNLQVPSVCFVPSHLLSTLAIGRTTSVVLDIGFHESTLLPIYHGRGLDQTHLLTSPRAGKRLAKRLRALLLHFSSYVTQPASAQFLSGSTHSPISIKGRIPAELLTWDFLEEIKAKALLVGNLLEGDIESGIDVLVHQESRTDWTSGTQFSENDESADLTLMQVLESRYKPSSKAKDITIVVPPLPREAVTPVTQPSTLGAPSNSSTTGRGSILIPGWIRERAAEVLFENGDEDELSLVEMILRTLIKLPIDLRVPMAKNIYISGGTAMLPGLIHRIRKELIKALVQSQDESSEGKRSEMVALSLPRVGPAKTESSASAGVKRDAIGTIEEKEEGSQILSSEHDTALLTVESKIMKQKRVSKEFFEHRAISTLVSSIAVLNDHAPRIDADGQSIGGIAPSFPANLSSWIGGSLMGSLRIGVINEMSREVWDEEQEERNAAKARAKKEKAEHRPGLGSGRGSFLGTVGGLDLGSYGALSSGARGTFSGNSPRSPSAT